VQVEIRRAGASRNDRIVSVTPKSRTIAGEGSIRSITCSSRERQRLPSRLWDEPLGVRE
jgi:hypothetical protein